MADNPTTLRYVGAGYFVPGVPSRDLTAEEVAEHGVEFLLATGLYKAAHGKPHPSENKALSGPESNKADTPDQG